MQRFLLTTFFSTVCSYLLIFFSYELFVRLFSGVLLIDALEQETLQVGFWMSLIISIAIFTGTKSYWKTTSLIILCVSSPLLLNAPVMMHTAQALYHGLNDAYASLSIGIVYLLMAIPLGINLHHDLRQTLTLTLPSSSRLSLVVLEVLFASGLCKIAMICIAMFNVNYTSVLWTFELFALCLCAARFQYISLLQTLVPIFVYAINTAEMYYYPNLASFFSVTLEERFQTHLFDTTERQRELSRLINATIVPTDSTSPSIAIFGSRSSMLGVGSVNEKITVNHGISITPLRFDTIAQSDTYLHTDSHQWNGIILDLTSWFPDGKVDLPDNYLVAIKSHLAKNGYLFIQTNMQKPYPNPYSGFIDTIIQSNFFHCFSTPLYSRKVNNIDIIYSCPV